MELTVTIKKEHEIELSEEDCERVLIKTLHNDWYSGFKDVMPESDKIAFSRVYHIYSAKHLV